MIRPIVGIRVKDKHFISLLNAEGAEKKSVQVTAGDFEDCQIPVYSCKITQENRIEKIYKIGQIKISDVVFENLKEDEDFKITSSLTDKGELSILVQTGKNSSYKPLKIYETNIYDDMQTQDVQEVENSLLDYGDFVKRGASDTEVLTEEDLSDDGILKEVQLKNSYELKIRKKLEKKNKKEQKKLARKEDKKSKAEYFENAEKAKTTKSSLAGKLTVFTIFMMVIVTAALLSVFSYNIGMDALNSTKKTAFNTNSQIQNAVSKKIESISKNAKILYALNALENKSGVDEFFKQYQDMVAVICDDVKIFNSTYILNAGLTEAKVENAAAVNKEAYTRAKYGKLCIKNVSHLLRQKTAVLYIPLEGHKVLKAVFLSDDLEDACLLNSSFEGFIIDRDGFIIAGLDSDKILTCQNLCDRKAVNRCINSEEAEEIFDYEENDEHYAAIYTKCDQGEFAVITTIPTIGIKLSVLDSIKKNACLCLSIIALAIIFVWFYGKRIAVALRAMTTASLKITGGNFNVKVRTHRQDELGQAIRTFNKMAESLSLREISGKQLEKFGDTELYTKAVNGELKMDGENKTAAVLVCSIRHFEKLSKRFRTEELYSFLNEYTALVEKAVKDNSGFVDKICGSTVTAVFGVPESSGSTRLDGINAIKAALKIERDLKDFNAKLENIGKPSLKLDIAVNSGSLSCGVYGTQTNKEYTFVGTTLDTAGALVKLNEKNNTSILVTESEYKIVKGLVNSEEAGCIDSPDGEGTVSVYSVSEKENEKE